MIFSMFLKTILKNNFSKPRTKHSFFFFLSLSRLLLILLSFCHNHVPFETNDKIMIISYSNKGEVDYRILNNDHEENKI